MKYQEKYITKLNNEVRNRFDNLLFPLCRPITNGTVWIDGADIRLAVDDFRTILTEIRKLK